MSHPYKRKETSEYAIASAKFVAGASAYDNFPSTSLPEVAFFGRSNVGKSTLLNRLTRSRDLARTSSKPGHTQQFNIFQVEAVEPRNGSKYEVNLVDLPGFGYAKFSKNQRDELGLMMGEYISKREQLRIVCLLVDARRDPGPEELAVRDLTFNSDRNIIIILTKMDEIKRQDWPRRIAVIAESFCLTADDVVLAGENLPAAKIWQKIFLLLSFEASSTES